MKKSKFVGKRFGNWECTNIYLRRNYSHGTKHNAYTYQLERITSDKKCMKTFTVSGTVMTKIGKGIIDPEDLAIKEMAKQQSTGIVLYRYLRENT